MQTAGAGVEPAARHRGRVVAEGRRGLHVALLEAHALAVLQVDCRNQQHGWERERLRGFGAWVVFVSAGSAPGARR
jgi:hypothetical protein